MSKPIPGRQYTVKTGDTLSGISSQAYGDSSLYSRISGANPGIIDPDSLVAGQIINIPPLPERKAIKTAQSDGALTNRPVDQLTLKINDIEIPVLSANVLRTMDTVSDGWTAEIPWVPGEDPAIDRALSPFSYPTAAVYLGNELIINGVLYTIEPSLSVSGQTMGLEGYSFTADIIDSMVLPPYEVNNVTLENRAKDLIQAIGIDVVFETDSGGPFDRITAKPTDTIYKHLVSLATQRGFLMSSTAAGDLLFLKAAIGGNSVGTLAEKEIQVSEWSARYDGRKRFNTYRATQSSPKTPGTTAIVTDDRVPRSRFMTIRVNDLVTGAVKRAAEWRRSKQLAAAMTFTIPVTGWYAPNGRLWTPNTLVSVISETMFIPDGFTFLIKSVEYTYGETYGAVLSLVPPEVYTGEALEEPWL